MADDIKQYEVLRGERFSHMSEPIITFAQKMIWINMICLKRLPDTVYVHLLLFREKHRLIIKPSTEESPDVIRWCTPSGKPRKIMCEEEFWQDITMLMGWDDQNRYRIPGRFIHGSGWDGIAFDMARAEVFTPGATLPSSMLCAEATGEKASPSYQTWEEYCQNPLVSRIEKDVVIVIDEVE